MSGPTFAPRAAGFPLGLTGAVAATRYVGGTASGAPITGTFAAGDFVIALSGNVWVCTAAGSPGTWTSLSPGVELAYAEIVSNVTGISTQQDITGLAITFATASRPAMIEVFFPLVQQVTSTGIPTLYLSDASNNELGRCSAGTLAASAVLGGLVIKCRIAAGTASATYHVRAQTSAGTLNILTSNLAGSKYRPYIQALSV